jgi:hypothetical protein
LKFTITCFNILTNYLLDLLLCDLYKLAVGHKLEMKTLVTFYFTLLSKLHILAIQDSLEEQQRVLSENNAIMPSTDAAKLSKSVSPSNIDSSLVIFASKFSSVHDFEHEFSMIMLYGVLLSCILLQT